MLGMMIPTPSISRNSVRKRIASARLSSTAPPVPPQRPPMIGTPYREVNRAEVDRKSTRLNSSHLVISYAVFCLKKKKKNQRTITHHHRITFLPMYHKSRRLPH